MVVASQRAGWTALVLFLLCWFYAARLRAQLSTTDHLADPGFWPTQNSTSRNDYVGPAACASCHRAKVASQQAASMAGTAHRAGDAGVLHSHPELKFDFGKYRYEIKTSAKGSVYSVTDGNRTLSANLVWAFGTAMLGSHICSRNRMETSTKREPPTLAR